MILQTRPVKSALVWFFVMVISACTTGCGSLEKPFPVKGRYALGVSPASSGETGAQNAASSGSGLRIEQVRVSEPYNGVSFVYRTGELAYSSDYYNEFIAPPGKLLTDVMVATLRQKDGFAGVVGPWATSDWRWRLESTVMSMHGDYRKANSPQAVIEGHFILIEEKPDSSRVVGQWTFSVSEPMPSATAPDFAAACSRAYGRMIDQLADAMRPTIRT